jgi:CarD family transcriptional regulator
MAELFGVEELVIYGGTGVCRVKEVTEKKMSGGEARMYYVLDPLFQDGTIYTPVDTKTYMRPVMTAPEAERVIDAIPDLKAECYHDRNFNQLATRYEQVLGSHEFLDIVGLALSIREKKVQAELQSKKLGQVDTKFMKRAESLINGELSVALGIPQEEVPGYIECRVQKVRQQRAARK